MHPGCPLQCVCCKAHLPWRRCQSRVLQCLWGPWCVIHGCTIVWQPGLICTPGFNTTSRFAVPITTTSSGFFDFP